jgi:hypothetical protein
MFIGNLLRYNVYSTIIEEGLWEMCEGEVPNVFIFLVCGCAKYRTKSGDFVDIVHSHVSEI